MTTSISFTHYIRVMYGFLLIQFLNACNSIVFLCFILEYTIKLAISLFLDLNQPTIAKTDKFLLLQIIEKIPELKFKYMGSYPSDKVPQLTKYSFAITNSAPSTGRGERWIMTTRLDKNYYIADSLARERSIYPFLTKKYRRMVPQKPQKTESLCGIYAIYSALLLFRFFQKNLNKVHDVHVLSFISIFM